MGRNLSHCVAGLLCALMLTACGAKATDTAIRNAPVWKVDDYLPKRPQGSKDFEVLQHQTPIQIAAGNSRTAYRICLYSTNDSNWAEILTSPSNYFTELNYQSCIDIDTPAIFAGYSCFMGNCGPSWKYRIARYRDQTKKVDQHLVAGWYGLVRDVNKTHLGIVYASYSQGKFVDRDRTVRYRVCSKDPNARVEADNGPGSAASEVPLSGCQIITGKRFWFRSTTYGAVATFQSIEHDET